MIAQSPSEPASLGAAWRHLHCSSSTQQRPPSTAPSCDAVLQQPGAALAQWYAHALRSRLGRREAALVWGARVRRRQLLRAAKQVLTGTLQQYRLYRQVNLYSEAFQVQFRDNLAWINGCPLGRVGGVQEDWRALNSALGFAAIMLNTLGARLGYNFPVHLVIPMGSYSKLANAGNKKGTLDL